MEIDITKPLFFHKNRVYRIYKGGSLFADFFDDDSQDGDYPEEWVASVVAAINPGHEKPGEGLSVIENTEITLKELMEQYPEEMCGASHKFSLLVKLLDSAIRLPLQVHPNPAFSEKYLNSSFGKTEMWIILATREDASIYFGFCEEMTKEKFLTYVERSETEKHVMDNLLNRVPVKKGDVFLIPAKSVHAIGAGCLILEIQEPTDFTISPEYWCGDHKLNEAELYLGLDKNTALDCFDYGLSGKNSVTVARKQPRVLKESDGIKEELLMGYDDTPCFHVTQYTIEDSKINLSSAPAIYIVTGGNGTVTSSGYRREIKKGDYFFLPYAAKEKCDINTESRIEIVQCLPHSLY